LFSLSNYTAFSPQHIVILLDCGVEWNRESIHPNFIHLDVFRSKAEEVIGFIEKEK